MAAVKRETDGIIIEVKAKPNAERTEVKLFCSEEGVTIAVAAVADKEKANKELVKFLSGLFGVQKDNISILSGQHTNRKRIKIVMDRSIEEVINIIGENIS